MRYSGDRLIVRIDYAALFGRRAPQFRFHNPLRFCLYPGVDSFTERSTEILTSGKVYAYLIPEPVIVNSKAPILHGFEPVNAVGVGRYLHGLNSRVGALPGSLGRQGRAIVQSGLERPTRLPNTATLSP